MHTRTIIRPYNLIIMSISCEATNCSREADLQCSCKAKSELCNIHFREHYRACRSSAIPLDELLREQAEKIVENEKSLIGMKENIMSQSDNLITTIINACTELLQLLNTKQQTLKEMKFGKSWENEKLESIMTAGFSNTQYQAVLETFSNTKEIIQKKTDFLNIADSTAANSKNVARNIYNGLIDLSKIVRTEIIYASKTPNFEVTVERATYMDQTLAVKTYTAISPTDNLVSIETEIECHQKLTSMSKQDNCFIRFYGCLSKRNSISLVMDYYKSSLMDAIQEKLKTTSEFSEQNLFIIFTKLLLAYGEMASVGIFHKDIKPHNILIDDELNMKLFDFGMCILRPDITTDTEEMNPVRGTHRYMAPELEELIELGQKSGRYSLEKSDVFSLGMVLLQLCTLIDIFGLNTFSRNYALMSKVKSVKFSWAQNLLEKMLAADYRERPTFAECSEWIRR